MMRPLDYKPTWGLSESCLAQKSEFEEDSSMSKYSYITLREKPE